MADLETSVRFASLFAWLILCFFVAGMGATASIDAAAFYAQLNQPAWAPPAGAFGPVWTTLYTLMAFAMWQVWLTPASPLRKAAAIVFVVQLFFNGLWSWLFFHWHLGAWAFADSALMWALILVCVVLFWRLKRSAGLLMLPYLAWVTLATALSWYVWQHNPTLL